MPDEHWTTRSYIHLPPPRSLEATRVRVRSETITDVLLPCLVDEGERDFLLEGPGEELIYGSSHDHKEEAHVRVLAQTISIEIDPSTHLVTMSAGVEWRRVQ